MKNEKGVTLFILVIIVLIMAILMGAVITYGVNSLSTVKFQNFNFELQQVQGKVDAIYEKIKNGETKYITYGSNITESEDAMATLLLVKGIDYSNMTDTEKEQYYDNGSTCYRYLSQSVIKNLLDISSTPGDMIINFTTREVISVKGFLYDGTRYYTLTNMS